MLTYFLQNKFKKSLRHLVVIKLNTNRAESIVFLISVVNALKVLKFIMNGG